MKRLLHMGVFSLIICLVFAFSWPGSASASNLSKEESTSVLPVVPYLSLLLLQEEKEGKTPPPSPKVINPNKPDEQEKQGGNPNKPGNKAKGQPGNPNKPDGGNQGNVARGSSLPTALIIALIGVVGAAGLWFVLRRRSS